VYHSNNKHLLWSTQVSLNIYFGSSNALRVATRPVFAGTSRFSAVCPVSRWNVCRDAICHVFWTSWINWIKHAYKVLFLTDSLIVIMQRNSVTVPSHSFCHIVPTGSRCGACSTRRRSASRHARTPTHQWRFDTIPECNRRTDGQADRQRDGHRCSGCTSAWIACHATALVKTKRNLF